MIKILFAVLLLAACTDVDDVSLEAQPFISYNGVSVAAAEAKCDGFGYGALPDHHAACVRMIRADYCGDGESWTQDGTEINLYDSLGINTDSADWSVDAEWTPAGARCVNQIRDFQPGEPSCFEELFDTGCGLNFDHALLINEWRGE